MCWRRKRLHGQGRQRLGVRTARGGLCGKQENDPTGLSQGFLFLPYLLLMHFSSCHFLNVHSSYLKYYPLSSSLSHHCNSGVTLLVAVGVFKTSSICPSGIRFNLISRHLLWTIMIYCCQLHLTLLLKCKIFL